MADDAEAVEADEGGAPVLGVVDAAPEAPKGLARQHVPDAAAERGGELVVEQRFNRLDEPFADFQRDVAREAVADDDVGFRALRHCR